MGTVGDLRRYRVAWSSSGMYSSVRRPFVFEDRGGEYVYCPICYNSTDKRVKMYVREARDMGFDYFCICYRCGNRLDMVEG